MQHFIRCKDSYKAIDARWSVSSELFDKIVRIACQQKAGELSLCPPRHGLPET